jgi:hypothetical protein
MVKGRIEKLTHKLLLRKKNFREGCWELSEEKNTKSLSVHPLLHLQAVAAAIFKDQRLRDERKDNGRGHSRPDFLA